jgi:CubicO group peptidase (beta-lactamase class C family)
MIDATMVAAKPEDLDIEPERLEAVFARARREVDDGVLPSAQVAVARHGKLAGMRTFGSAVQGGAELPATDETLYHIFSCTKAVVAAAVWLLFESGDLRLDERVAEIIPEFGTNGKDVITVEQLMLHAGGFPYAPFAPRLWGDHGARIDAFARWRLNWPVDSRYEYHPTSAHWVLVEIIERRTGMEYKAFIRERITGPLGLDELHIGRPAEQNARVADVRWMGEPVEPPGGWGEVTPEAILRSNQLEFSATGAPGGSGVSSAASLALFYQALINGGVGASGARIMKPDTIAFATEVRSKPHHIEQTTNVFVNRGLSIVVAGDDGNAFMRGFGRTCSGRAVGHGGAGGQIAWGDPATGISLGFCTDGFADYMNMGRRITAISSLAANCGL